VSGRSSQVEFPTCEMAIPGDDFPRPLPDDPKTVVMALETGSAEWDRGELNEAVRWIRRAADAAEASGDDLRALSLARMAADLKSTLELPATIPPREPLAPFDDFNDETIVDSPVALFAQKAARPGAADAGQEESEDEAAERPTSPSKSGNARDQRSRVRPRTALRVAISSATASDGTLRVRVLDESSAVPGGEAEALLVVLDPDAQLPGLGPLV
jgi:hypothetical protein